MHYKHDVDKKKTITISQSQLSRVSDSVLLLADCVKEALSLVNLKLKQLSSQGTYRKNSFRFGISMIQRTTLYVDKFNFETKLFSDTL